ncbi:hypothetical protein BSCH_01966c [Candidatus Paraburkholderia schumanniana]|nr:hypothetical protein BSCH_01966c [Candidatus Paraburkholderia schumannianae]
MTTCRRVQSDVFPMAKLLSDTEFLRFTELQQKQANFTITSDEADELREIVARAQKKRDDRAATMQAIETYIAQFDITPDELFSAEQIGDAARTFGLIPAVKKERTLPPQLTYNGKPYQWTSRALPEEIRVPLFEAFTSGQSVKPFIATPKDTSRCALTIARLEKETGNSYAKALLGELSLSRAQIDEALARLAA